MQGAAARTTSPELRHTIGRHVEELDRIIRDIRSAVFALRPKDPDEHG